MTRAEALVGVRNVSKRFGATRALKDVTVDFEAGRVHALVGENGAGKSTLCGVVLGVHAPDSGELLLRGSPMRLDSPAQGAGHGLVGVAQELSLLPAMSVVDNVVLGSEKRRGPFVDQRANRRRVEALMAEHGLETPLEARAGSLSVADQQKVEILRALGRESRLVVLDEPTARLAGHEAEDLHRTVRGLAERGVAVVYVSHFLNEVLSVADTVTVMRDGRIVRTASADAETQESLVEGMTGRHIGEIFPPKPPAPVTDAEVVLRVSGLCSADGDFSDVSFEIRAGEILGLAGLVGAGRSELVHAVYGAGRVASGSVELGGRRLAGDVAEALAAGVGLIPESRRDQGLVGRRAVLDNTTLPHLRSFAGWAGIRGTAERQSAEKACRDVGVRTASLQQPVQSLSGGNQQKVLFARAVLGELRLLLADEPTRGVDVGSKQAIYEALNEMARAGCAVLLVSSELEEVIGTCHRVLVMRNGRIVGHYEDADMTAANLLAASFGTHDAAAEAGGAAGGVEAGDAAGADEAGAGGVGGVVGGVAAAGAGAAGGVEAGDAAAAAEPGAGGVAGGVGSGGADGADEPGAGVAGGVGVEVDGPGAGSANSAGGAATAAGAGAGVAGGVGVEVDGPGAAAGAVEVSSP
ncbi:MAG: sugar ABC transporter ATP-binding protein [Acidimicrobiaceae bacterium]|nr:sugar ABC transporter ATP-binding protein [Acidimicrobiaceae bacterium]MCY4294950.1 sugar ABC transporter ATP-binding protein [Acidimicrobiaceae bacterium]